jgi:hypothetical protein
MKILSFLKSLFFKQEEVIQEVNSSVKEVVPVQTESKKSVKENVSQKPKTNSRPRKKKTESTPTENNKSSDNKPKTRKPRKKSGE